MVPGSFLCENLVPNIVKRLSDKNALVRQKAMDLLSAAILNNPFCRDGGQDMEFDLEKQTEKLIQMKNKLDVKIYYFCVCVCVCVCVYRTPVCGWKF